MHCTTRLNIEATTHHTVLKVRNCSLLPVWLREGGVTFSTAHGQSGKHEEKPILSIFFSMGVILLEKTMCLTLAFRCILPANFKWFPPSFFHLRREREGWQGLTKFSHALCWLLRWLSADMKLFPPCFGRCEKWNCDRNHRSRFLDVRLHITSRGGGALTSLLANVQKQQWGGKDSTSCRVGAATGDH